MPVEPDQEGAPALEREEESSSSSSAASTSVVRRLESLELEEEDEEDVVRCGLLGACCLPWNKRSSQQYSLAKADAVRGDSGRNGRRAAG